MNYRFDATKKVTAEKFHATIDFDRRNVATSLPNILPTPFTIKDNYLNAPLYGTEKVNTDYVVFNASEIMRMGKSFTPGQFKILFAIARSIIPGQNYIKINAKLTAASAGIVNRYNYWNLFSELCDVHHLLARTNIRGVYIIDHNVLFKGDINKFVKEYYDTYKDYELKYTYYTISLTNKRAINLDEFKDLDRKTYQIRVKDERA